MDLQQTPFSPCGHSGELWFHPFRRGIAGLLQEVHWEWALVVLGATNWILNCCNVSFVTPTWPDRADTSSSCTNIWSFAARRYPSFKGLLVCLRITTCFVSLFLTNTNEFLPVSCSEQFKPAVSATSLNSQIFLVACEHGSNKNSFQLLDLSGKDFLRRKGLNTRRHNRPTFETLP